MAGSFWMGVECGEEAVNVRLGYARFLQLVGERQREALSQGASTPVHSAYAAPFDADGVVSHRTPPTLYILPASRHGTGQYRLHVRPRTAGTHDLE